VWREKLAHKISISAISFATIWQHFCAKFAPLKPYPLGLSQCSLAVTYQFPLDCIKKRRKSKGEGKSRDRERERERERERKRAEAKVFGAN